MSFKMNEENKKNRPTLYLIDGSSYIYRAYYALPPLSTSKGFPTNAVFGFASMLFRVIKEDQPDLISVIFDVKGPTFRHEVFKEYKSNRPPMPDDLSLQIPYIKKLVLAVGISLLEIQGYEADDVIGTITEKMKDQYNILIITGDKDALQLIDPQVSILRELRQKERVFYDAEKVKNRYGVGPENIVDLLALMGDKVDNIPGVPGIGEKTARDLLLEFGSLENILQRASEIKRPKLREKILEHTEQAKQSKFLATIHRNVPIEIIKKDFAIKPYKQKDLILLLRDLEFSALLKQIPKTLQEEKKEPPEHEYHTILDQGPFEDFLSQLHKVSEFALDTETTHKDPMRAKLVGLSFSLSLHQAYYIPLKHHYLACPKQLDLKFVLEQLRPILESEKIKKIGQNIKYDYLVLSHYGIKLGGISFDTMIASYLLNPNKQQHNLETIALEYLSYQMVSYKELTGTGKNEINFSQVEIEKAGFYSCEDADITYQASRILEPQLHQEGLGDLFYSLELPLIEILAYMEQNGVKIDTEALSKMSGEIKNRLFTLSEQIYFLAGEKFNIDSPKQLAYILFEKLKLPIKKRTKTGPSTNVEVLTKLAEEQFDLPMHMLEYRQLKKLKSTYIDALPCLIHPKTGRVHTSFNQSVTATGRLSSSDPNLQNIPIRTDLGKKIREAFIPETGCLLLSADYSQIELRILAHLSQDPILIDAFLKGEDIHTRTACEIFDISPNQVNGEMRRRAKVVNFGIIYGMSAYGLAKDLGIDRTTAGEYIDHYFSRYAGVRAFLDKTIQQAKETGYVTTLFHRKRHLPELLSSNKNNQQTAERMAINTPVQGTAADLIKLAMIHIYKKLQQFQPSTKMILQIHDELLFEVPEKEIEEIRNIVRLEMEEVLSLKVPLKVDIGIGTSWAMAH